MSDIYDFIIIGGGTAGLFALKQLTGQKYKVLCLEKEKECGGSVRTLSSDGYRFNSGPDIFYKNDRELNEFIKDSEFKDLVVNKIPSHVIQGPLFDRIHKNPSKNQSVLSLLNGMGDITDQIYREHIEKIVLSCDVKEVYRKDGVYQVSCSWKTFRTNKLIFATPAPVTSGMVRQIDDILAELLGKIKYQDIISAWVTCDSSDIELQKLQDSLLKDENIQGVVNTSLISKDYSPTGKKLLKVYIGNKRNKELLQLSDDKIDRLLQIGPKRKLIKIEKIKNAIPEMDLKIKRNINQYLKQQIDIFLVGGYLEDFGINAAIKSGAKLKDIKKTVPEIVKNDPWLEPFTDAILARNKRAVEIESYLLKDCQSLAEFSNGHEFFGMHHTATGWTFREWAPNAQAIYIIGDFNEWKDDERFRLKELDDNGVWGLEMDEEYLNHLDYYKLRIYWEGGNGERIPSYANYVVQDEITHLFCARIWNPEKKYHYKNPPPNLNDQAPFIYEAHIGMAQMEGKVGSYNEFRKHTLPRIVEGGYNTLQIMAVQEHPYYGSFGYQVSNFFAPSCRFGTPDELKELIDEAHGMGIKVIMDIIHSHAVKNELEGLAKFDGTSYQYFHVGDKGNHPAWDTMCFDYSKPQVLHFLLSNCKYWIDEFGFDGFRFDGVSSMLYFSHGLGQAFSSYHDYYNEGVDEDAVVYFTLANKLIHQVKKDAISIAEDMSGMAGLAVPIESGGVGFDYRLSMGVPDFWIKTLKELGDENWNVEKIWQELISRRSDEKVISYAESHDQALVGDKTIIFRLIDKDMYTNMKVNNRNLIVDRGLALHKMIRLVTAGTAGGGYLNFIGNEFGHPEWVDFPRVGNNWSYHYARRQWNLRDDENLCYKFLADFDREMITLIRTHNIISKNNWPNLFLGHVDDQLLGFERETLLFIFNFSPYKSYENYTINAFPGSYELVLNSDSKRFGGFGNIGDGKDYHTFSVEEGEWTSTKLSLYLPPRTAIVLKRKEQ